MKLNEVHIEIAKSIKARFGEKQLPAEQMIFFALKILATEYDLYDVVAVLTAMKEA